MTQLFTDFLTANPGLITKANVGLDSVDNTADIDKPISSATQAAISGLLAISGEYIPVLTAGANVSSVIRDGAAMSMRVGAVVTVSGFFHVTPVAAGEVTKVNIQLPCSSSLADFDLVGVAMGLTGGEGPAQIRADSIAHEAQVMWVAPSSGLSYKMYTFTYRVR